MSSLCPGGNIREVPLCQTSAGGVMHALLGDGQDSFVGEEQLLHGTNGAIARCMAAIRSIALESGAVEGGYAAVVIASP